MIIFHRNKFIKSFLLSILLFIIGLILALVGSTKNFLDFYPVNILIVIAGIILLVVGYFFYIWSHYELAKAKGYSGWLVLLGFINTFGLLILFLLPDRRKNNLTHPAVGV